MHIASGRGSVLHAVPSEESALLSARQDGTMVSTRHQLSEEIIIPSS